MSAAPPIDEITPAEWTDAMRDLFAMYEGEEARQNGSKHQITRILARHPELGKNYYKFSQTLSGDGLSPVLRELVVLRVAWTVKSDYEWAQHVRIGKLVGVSEAHIEAVKQGPDASIFSEAERAALNLAGKFQQEVPDEDWAALRLHFDQKQMLQLLFLVAGYGMTSWILGVLGIRSEQA